MESEFMINFNFVSFNTDRNSEKAQKLCFSNRIDTGSGIKHRVECKIFLIYNYN